MTSEAGINFIVGFITLRKDWDVDMNGNLQPICHISENGKTTTHKAVRIIYNDQ